MANPQYKIFTDTIIKLNIPKNDLLVKKAFEIQNQVKAKSDVWNHINDSAKIVLSVDISCELLNIDVSKKELAKLSSLSLTQYNKNRKIILKVLNLNKKVTIAEIIKKLNLSHSVERLAKTFLKFYMEQQFYENEEIDASVYAMCVYFACKSENIKIAKRNILIMSNLTQAQWTKLEKSFEKWTPNVMTKKMPKENKNDPIDSMVSDNTDLIIEESQNSKSHEESYEAWSKRILTQAYKDLKKAK
ncbi:hypothetical protein PVAND_003619 [Polypedilum vanderplanki]|uniref:Origin recognition complex subunit 6 n=1 Tax=Polypedilum vanderplanki TaxID=319348 RepID=A0A9J6BV47_POLVA|nr:hypothetical protein PVAND_003619 [Polypedilum vanderplanki]